MATLNDEQPGGARPFPMDGQPVHAPAPRVTGGTPVTRAYALQDYANKEFKRHIDNVAAQRDHFTPDGMHSAITSFANTECARAAHQAIEEVNQRVAQAAQREAQIRASLRQPGDTAQELRNTRYRDRMKSEIDAAADAGKVVATAQRLMASADRSELGVLLEELPSCLRSRGVPTDWIEPQVAQLAPEYGAARAEHVRAEQARAILERNKQTLHNSFVKGHVAHVILDPARYDPDR